MGSIDRLKGTVKWFDSRRGFGFISPEESEGDLFVHKSSIEGAGVRSLTAGEIVEFVVSVGDDGRSSAVSVTGSGGVCIPRRRYFGGACYRCNEVGHMARDCKSNVSFCSLGPCYSCGLMGHLARQCPTTLFPNFLDGLFSGGIDSEEEEQSDESCEVEPQRGEETRNWAELPDDILLVIFQKITAAEILRSAQFVCKPWRRLSFVPTLWRCINIKLYDPFIESVAIMAVDRSKGCLEELHVEYYPTETLMRYITERATKLRCLHLIAVYLADEILVEMVRKFPLLEELEIMNISFSNVVIEQVAQTCPQLKSFSFNERLCKFAYADPDSFSDRNVDMGALAIAKHMKQLRRLQLFGNCLTSTGLLAILDNCPHLEVLDIRQCLNVVLDEKLKKKCGKIKVLKLPNDSTTDYHHNYQHHDDLDIYDSDSDQTYIAEHDFYDSDSDQTYISELGIYDSDSDPTQFYSD